MKPQIPAKVQESNLTSLVLFLKRMDIAGFAHCDFISSPGKEDVLYFIIILEVIYRLILPCRSQEWVFFKDL